MEKNLESTATTTPEELDVSAVKPKAGISTLFSHPIFSTFPEVASLVEKNTPEMQERIATVLAHIGYHMNYWFQMSEASGPGTEGNGARMANREIGTYHQESADFNYYSLIYFLLDALNGGRVFNGSIPGKPAARLQSIGGQTGTRNRVNFGSLAELRADAEKNGIDLDIDPFELLANATAGEKGSSSAHIFSVLCTLRESYLHYREFIEQEHAALDCFFNAVSGKFLEKDLTRNFWERRMYATDATDLHVEIPVAVFYPRTREDLQRMIRLATSHKINLVPRGGGVGCTGGCVPLDKQSVVVSLEKMNHIDEVQTLTIDKTEQKFLWAGAGAITLNVDEKAGESGQFFAVDPASKRGSSVGGNLAENAGGPRAFEFGSAIDNVLAWKFVDPRGKSFIVERAAPLPITGRIQDDEEVIFNIYTDDGKESGTFSEGTRRPQKTICLKGSDIRKRGLAKDVMNKFLGGLPGVGKEGTDGVITDICWAVHEKPKHLRSFFVEARNFGKAHAFIMKFLEKRKGRSDFRIMQMEQWDATYARIAGQAEPVPDASFLFDIGTNDLVVLAELEKELLEQSTETMRISLDTEGKGNNYRHKLKGISKGTNGFKLNEDIVIKIGDFPKLNDYIKGIHERYHERWESLKQKLLAEGQYPGDEIFAQSSFIVAFHAHYGDGNAHVNIPLFAQFPEMIALAEECTEEVFRMILSKEFGGSMTGEHGLGLLKTPILLKLWEECEVAQAAGQPIPYDIEHAVMELQKLSDWRKEIDPNQIWHRGALDLEHRPDIFTLSNQRLLDVLRSEMARVDGFLKERYPHPEARRKAKTEMQYTPKVYGLMIDIVENIRNCVRCGACKPSCGRYYLPDQDSVMSPRDKNLMIRAVLTMLVEHMLYDPDHPVPGNFLVALKNLVNSCSDCGRCETACPVKIDSGYTVELVNQLLDHFQVKTVSPLERLVGNATLARRMGRLGMQAGSVITGRLPGNIIGGMENPVRGTPSLAQLAAMAANFQSSSGRFIAPEGWTGDPLSDASILWLGCPERIMAPETEEALLFLVHLAQMPTLFSEESMCCGLTSHAITGKAPSDLLKENRETLISLIQRAINAGIISGHSGLKKILSASPSCGDELENATPLLAQKRDRKKPSLTEALGVSVEHAMPTILRRLLSDTSNGVEELLKQNLPDTILYQESCHGKGLGKEYKEILGPLGVKVIVQERCCGALGGKVGLDPKKAAAHTTYTGETLVPLYKKAGEGKLSVQGAADCVGCRGTLEKAEHQGAMIINNPEVFPVIIARALNPKFREVAAEIRRGVVRV